MLANVMMNIVFGLLKKNLEPNYHNNYSIVNVVKIYINTGLKILESQCNNN